MKLFQQFNVGELDELGKACAAQLFPNRPSWAVASISIRDAAHFAGLIAAVKPNKIIEVGVASGWGSVVLMEGMRAAGHTDFEYFGIDISSRFFLDNAFATGAAVPKVAPEFGSRYHLITGKPVSQVIDEVGPGIDFGFIDADHMHPWATLDLLSIMPYMSEDSWVALHDLNLSRVPRHQHKNRGTKYLFEGWVGDRVHSIENPTMAGAIKLEGDSADYLDCVLDILYTPWEIPIQREFIDPVIQLVQQHYGDDWAEKFQKATVLGNSMAKRANNRRFERLLSKLYRLKFAIETGGQNVYNGIFRAKEDR